MLSNLNKDIYFALNVDGALRPKYIFLLKQIIIQCTSYLTDKKLHLTNYISQQNNFSLP